MSPPRDSTSNKRAHRSAKPTDRGPSPGSDENVPPQKKRAQRASYACERCRTKKLRCTGGDPCTVCQRVKAECDFGDRGEAWPQSSATTERITQLERTVTDLVSGLTHLIRQPVDSQSTAVQSLSEHSQPVSSSGYGAATASLATTGRLNDSLPSERNNVEALLETSSLSYPRSSTTILSGPVVAQGQSYHQQQYSKSGATYTPASATHSSPSETINSRWTALQHDPAPFPAMMAHPTAWSGQPATTSPQGEPDAVLGMTHYRANVNLRSEPVSAEIIDASVARELFRLYFEKCHPLFPLLHPDRQGPKHSDHILHLSPFLSSVILAIAGRYYNADHESQIERSTTPQLTAETLQRLADMACAHLGFALFRKQHQLEDVQAALLMSVWIPRGSGQSADQWLVAGFCIRLAQRIGVSESFAQPIVTRLLRTGQQSSENIAEWQDILLQWHTWLAITQYNTSLSLGFGRPQTGMVFQSNPRDYLTVTKRLERSACTDIAAVAYMAGLGDLSLIAAELISGLRAAQLPRPAQHNPEPSLPTTWSQVSDLLSQLNPRLDEWQRRWMWSGSYDAIRVGRYSTLVKIYGEHTRLCLNSLSMNMLAASGAPDRPQHPVAASSLTKACEAAVALVQCYVEAPGKNPIVRYGPDYLVLVLGQAAVFFVRVLVAKPGLPLPMDQLVLEHYLTKAIEHLRANNFSTTNICGWVADLVSDLARHAGLTLQLGRGATIADPPTFDSGLPDLDWDFDISALLGQNMPAGETGLDLGHYFDFNQPFIPLSPDGATRNDAG